MKEKPGGHAGMRAEADGMAMMARMATHFKA
jgi:hypothetical protein